MATNRRSLLVMLCLATVVRLDAAPPPRLVDNAVSQALLRGRAEGTERFDHGPWLALLARHVDERGAVDYWGLKRERQALDAYLEALARADLARLSPDDGLALLLNAYNACTVDLIVGAANAGTLPRSIRDLEDPWRRPSCRLAGVPLSLEVLEHGLIRPWSRDARVHAALNCASKGCPALRGFRGEGLDAQLEGALRALINDRRHVLVERGRLRVSALFDWYRSDFVGPSWPGSAADLADLVLRYADPPLRADLARLGPSPRIEVLDYDWDLNGR